MNLTIPPNLRPWAFGLLALISVATLAAVAAVLFTGHDLGDPRVTTPLGFAFTIITVLLAALGISSQVAATHEAINGRMSQLVDTTAASAFQAGQSAPAGAPLPPAPSTMVPVPGTLTGATGARGPAGPAGPTGPAGPAGGTGG